MAEKFKQNIFVVRLIDTQHQTWQGTVTWLETQHTQPFRSLLEMVQLMDSVMDDTGTTVSEAVMEPKEQV